MAPEVDLVKNKEKLRKMD